MKFTHSTAKDRSTARWAGGTTTQLAVFPETAEFTKYNFIFRMSTATVEVEESTFTFMPGVTRHLMILKGELTINHTGRYEKHLPPLALDTFYGEWPTTAKGKVTDFNLMTIGNAKGKLFAEKFDANEHKELKTGAETDYTGFYLLNGDIKISCGSFSAQMQEGDFILVKHEEKKEEKFLFESAGSGNTLIISEIIL